MPKLSDTENISQTSSLSEPRWKKLNHWNGMVIIIIIITMT